MVYIVSANYRDKSRFKPRWLVRRTRQNPKNAKAVRAVVATGVKFEFAKHKMEHGFGCAVVAVCQTVETPKKIVRPGGGIKLYFNYNEFINFKNGERITSCKLLILGARGSMTAYL